MCPARRRKSAPSSLWSSNGRQIKRRSASPVLPSGPEDLPGTAASPEKSPASATSFETNPYIGVLPGQFPALPDNPQRLQQLILQWVDLQQSQLSPTQRTTDQIIPLSNQENLLVESPQKLLSPVVCSKGELACETMSGKAVSEPETGLSDIWH
jgi:hypothetical protein